MKSKPTSADRASMRRAVIASLKRDGIRPTKTNVRQQALDLFGVTL